MNHGDSTNQSGFAYMALLTVIAASLVSLSVALPDLYQTAQREREAQLLFVGQQYQLAIRHFYENPYVATKRYPRSIDELLVDKRGPKSIYHLRKAYMDPMMNSKEWGLIKNEYQQIMGVYSLSEAPLLKTNIPSDTVLISTRGGPKHSDLKFFHQAQTN